MGRVSNLWNGYSLTTHEQEMLTKTTLAEFKKPVHKRRTPQELMSRTLRLYSVKFRNKLSKLNNYERNKRCEWKGEQ